MIRRWFWLLLRGRDGVFMAGAWWVAVLTLVLVFNLKAALEQSVDAQSRALMASDWLIESDHELPEAWLTQAQQQAWPSALSQTLVSMVSVGDQAVLVGVRAVSPAYPLRGQLQLQTQPGAPAQVVRGSPPPGQVWVDQKFMGRMPLAWGSRLGLGEKTLVLSGVLAAEPDAPFDAFNFMPRIMVHPQDLQSSGLLQEGSRVKTRWLFAGPETSAWRQWLQPRLERGMRLVDSHNLRPEWQDSISRVLLLLNILAGAVLSCCMGALVLAGSRFWARVAPDWRLLRTLGMPQGPLLWHVLKLSMLMLGGVTVLGAALGWGLSRWVLQGLGLQQVLQGMPALGWQPSLWACASVWGCGLFIAFLVLAARCWQGWGRLRSLMGLGLLLIAGGAVWLSHPASGYSSVQVAWPVLLLVMGLMAGLWVCRRLLARLLPWHVTGAWGGWFWWTRQRPRDDAAQLAVFVALFWWFLLLILQWDWLPHWQTELTQSRPNRFVINLQKNQQADFAQALQQAGISARIWPMARARLQAINGRPVRASDYEDSQTQFLVEREFNMSWSADVPAGNHLTAGTWWADQHTPAYSVEQKIAQRLNLKLGDVLTFEAAGQRWQAPVRSLRKVSWESMQPNFYVLTPPSWWQAVPHSYMTSFSLQPSQQALEGQWLRRWPNLTFINTETIVGDLVQRLSLAVAALSRLGLLAVIGGALVLLAALGVGDDEQRREAQLLATLGASPPALQRMFWVRRWVETGLGALLACGAAMLLFDRINTLWLEQDWHPHGGWLIGGAGLGLVLTLASWFWLRWGRRG